MKKNWVSEAQDEAIRLETAMRADPKTFYHRDPHHKDIPAKPDGVGHERAKAILVHLESLKARLQPLVRA